MTGVQTCALPICRAADRVALLADGQVAECGHAKEVIDNPGSSRAIKFLAKVMG